MLADGIDDVELKKSVDSAEGDEYGEEDDPNNDKDASGFQPPEKKDQIEEMQAPVKSETFP